METCTVEEATSMKTSMAVREARKLSPAAIKNSLHQYFHDKLVVEDNLAAQHLDQYSAKRRHEVPHRRQTATQ